jgi:hypothetical protein
VDRRRTKAIVTSVAKFVLGVVVFLAVGRHVTKTWHELAAHREQLRIAPVALALSVPLYLVGLGLFGCFYTRILTHSPTPVLFLPAVRAYYISHLGKYVPGKALVVVMRAGLSASSGARPATAAFATLYETLVMMAAGGTIGVLGFLVPPVQWIPLAVSAGLGAAFLVVVAPRVFPWVSKLISVPFPGVGPDAFPFFSGRLLGEGLLWSVAGWVFLGLSEVAVISAIAPRTVALDLWPVIIASVALATVAGFAVAVLPAGLLVREWVLMTTLVPAVGENVAVVSTLLLRLVWVVAEVLAAAALGLVRPSLKTMNAP